MQWMGSLADKNYTFNKKMGNIGEDYPHLITGGTMVDQVQHLLSG